MPINIPAGAFSGGTGFADFAIPTAASAISGILAGKRQREQTEYDRSQNVLQQQRQGRQEALQQLQMLVGLHGANVVNLPEFSNLYSQITGNPWPTETVQQEVTPAQPAVPGQAAIPQISTPGEAWMNPQPAVPGQPARPAVTQSVTRPTPLGGKIIEKTMGELGVVQAGHPLFGVTPSQAKALGIDVGKLLNVEPKTESQVIGDILTRATQGRMTPEDAHALAMWHALKAADQRGPQTIEGVIAKALIENKMDPSTLPEWMQNFIKEKSDGLNKTSEEQKVMAQIAKDGGTQNLNDGQMAIYINRIQRPPKTMSWTEYLTAISRGEEPMPTTPEGRALVAKAMKGEDTGPVDKTYLRQLRIKAADSDAQLAAARSAVAKFYQNWKEKHPNDAAPTYGLEKEEWDKLTKAAEAARNRYNEYHANVRRVEEQMQLQQQSTDVPVGQQQPGATAPVPETPLIWATRVYTEIITKLGEQANRINNNQIEAFVLNNLRQAAGAHKIPEDHWQALIRLIRARKQPTQVFPPNG